MLALIYLALAIALGDLLCRRFYRFVSIAHRWAAAILVGVLLSAWFAYLAWLACYRTAEPLLCADILFFVTAAAAIFWLSRRPPEMHMIASRAPGSSTWDWITLAALAAAVCVLLMGTLYVNKQGRICLSGMEATNFALQSAIAQNFALGHNFPPEYPQYAGQPIHYPFLFYFQAGNLEFLGLNLAWGMDVLSVLGLTSALALVMALGELFFNSRVVGRLGAALFFCHASLRHLANFLPSGYRHRDESWGFLKQIAFVNQRYLPFAIGVVLLVLIFLVDRYRQRRSATAAGSDANIALQESKGPSNQVKTAFSSRFITRARSALVPAKSFLFSALLLAALPLWKAPVFMPTAVALCCLLLAYGFWWLSRMKRGAMLGRALAGALTACILAAGVVDLFAVYSSSRMEVNYERQPLVHGLVFRNFETYKIPESLAPGLAHEGSAKPPVTAFQGGRGDGKGQFNSPRAIAIDGTGNIYVADTDNGRIEKFSPSGVFITSMGTKAKGIGQLEAPNGIAIDRAGNIYVAEIGPKHRVRKLGADGTFIAAWAPGLYGPRKIAIGPHNSIYVVDSGGNRIVEFSSDGQVLTTWGSEGSGDGQFKGLSSVAVDPTNRVYVADPINSRIQVFDSTGKFLTKWSIPEWGQPGGFEDLAIDPGSGRLYASSAHMSVILVFDLQGNRLGTVTPTAPDKLDSPSALALAKDKLLVLNAGSARVSVISLPAK
jgi:DNA-binding beta-propeller fold protein YncE